MKQSTAQARATQKWEKNNYYKVMLRIPKAEEETIKAAAGDSINRFILDAVHEAIRRQNARQDAPGGTETVKSAAADTETAAALDALQEAETNAYTVPADLVQQMRKYGEPAAILREAVASILAEYSAGIRP